VIIPARDEVSAIGRVVRAVLAQSQPGIEIEVLVVDDGSRDGTAEAARQAGARVLRLDGVGNPAAARNRGAAAANGDPIIFLDADCVPAEGWLAAILEAHGRGEVVVGGSLDLPPGLTATARCDYYCGWYLIHPRRPAGPVPHHPPPNLSVRRDLFLATSGFTEQQPFAYTNEERGWQAELHCAGHRIWFEPRARVLSFNRPGFAAMLRRNYRWAYTALASKGETGSARFAWLWRHPRLLIAASGPLAVAHTAFIVGCWLRAGSAEPLLLLPAIFATRLAYAAGLAVGGVQWLRRRGSGAAWKPRWN
jgi:glycosyltransferase involved in cell wall biosynthesis